MHGLQKIVWENGLQKIVWELTARKPQPEMFLTIILTDVEVYTL